MSCRLASRKAAVLAAERSMLSSWLLCPSSASCAAMLSMGISARHPIVFKESHPHDRSWACRCQVRPASIINLPMSWHFVQCSNLFRLLCPSVAPCAGTLSSTAWSCVRSRQDTDAAPHWPSATAAAAKHLTTGYLKRDTSLKGQSYGWLTLQHLRRWGICKGGALGLEALRSLSSCRHTTQWSRWSHQVLLTEVAQVCQRLGSCCLGCLRQRLVVLAPCGGQCSAECLHSAAVRTIEWCNA